MHQLFTRFRSIFTSYLHYHLQPFPLITKCKPSSPSSSHSVVSSFLGTLILETDHFPFFMLIAFEAGGFPRALLLLAIAPLHWFIQRFISAALALRLVIFITFAGLKLSDIELISLGVLSKFFGERVRSSSYKLFSSFSFRCIATELPRIMVEPFAKQYLGAHAVIGTGIHSIGSRATGLCDSQGIITGEKKLSAVKQRIPAPDVGLGHTSADYPFMGFCEVSDGELLIILNSRDVMQEAYLVPLDDTRAMEPEKLAAPIIFHDGRLVQLPTRLQMLATILWIPIGFPLALLRIAAGSLLPMQLVYHAFLLLGVRIIIKGNPPPRAEADHQQHSSDETPGVMFVCNHRSLLDPIFLSAALGRPVTAVTYSISRLSEILSPIPTARLTRDRIRDSANIRELIRTGDLVVCPEGTTCRTPYLLRFSSLFAQLTDRIVPVGMETRVSRFHGSAARTWKGADPFYFFMNPMPSYSVTFLDQIPVEETCFQGGLPAHDVANYIQGLLAQAMGFNCTCLTRRDKYRALTGTDGVVAPPKPNSRLLPSLSF